MGAKPSGIKGLFWHPAEKRLRTPFRIPAAFLLVLLAAQIVIGLLSLVDGVVGLPGTVSVTIAFGLLTVAVVGISWFIDRRTVRDLGLDIDGQWRRDGAAGFVVGLGMVAVIVVVLRVSGSASLVDVVGGEPDLVLGGTSTVTNLLSGLLFFVAVGLLEEVVVRGYLLVNVAEGIRGYLPDDRTAVVLAIAATASLFGALHAANPGGTTLGLINITLTGLFLGGTYAVTSSLAFPIGLHAAWNFGLGPLFGLPISGLTIDAALVPVQVDGSTLLTGGSFGPEGGLVMLVALAYAALAFAWWGRRQYGPLALDERIAVPDLWIDQGGES